MLNFLEWHSGKLLWFLDQFVGIIQAATSINEQTLSFVPKLFVVLITFGLLANLMMVQLSDYFLFIFEQVAQVG